MNVLILGATGSVGQTIVQALERYEQYSITTGVREEVDWLPEKVEQTEFDLTDQRSIEDLIREAKPDITFNAAGLVGMEECDENPTLSNILNVLAVKLIAQSLPSGSRLVQISTQAVYEGTQGPYTETDIPSMESPTIYGEHKRLGEEMVKLTPHNIGVSIVRLTNVYGHPPYQIPKRKSQPYRMFDEMKAQGYKANPKVLNNPIFNGDLSAVWLMMVMRNDINVLHVGGKGLKSDFGFARDISAAVGVDGRIIESIEHERFRPSLYIDKLIGLQIRPKNIDQGISAFSKQYVSF